MVAPRDPRGALIPQFFAGRSVLITGGTGFVGKVLVERLLYTCPDVSRLHLLLRAKKGVSPAKRLAALKESQVFDVVRERCPGQLEKLVALEGDTSAPNLGLAPGAIATLQDKLVALEGDTSAANLGLAPGAIATLQDVSVVFHSAATLKFDEELRKAVDQNVRSVISLLEICDTLPNMQAFVHVSTAYSNAELSTVAERVYPAPAPLPAVLALTEHVSDAALATLTPQYIASKPNTYTFTKALAETAVERHGCSKYPVAIFRPTIVISSVQHPFPGWIENLNGPSGVVVGMGKGLLHVFRARPAKVDLLPVDLAVDTLIAVAWETAVDKSKEVRVYNCSTGDNPTDFREFEAKLRRDIARFPLDKAFWYPSGAVVESKLAQRTMEFLLQTVPLYIAEHTARMLGIKTPVNLITAGQRLSAMSDALEFFSTRQWTFETGRTRALQRRLSPQDRQIYNLDVMTINWDEHYLNFVKGTRRYLLRERDQDLDAARRHMTKMWLLHNAVKLLTFFLFLRVLLRNQLASSLVYGALRLLRSALFSTVYRSIAA